MCVRGNAEKRIVYIFNKTFELQIHHQYLGCLLFFVFVFIFLFFFCFFSLINSLCVCLLQPISFKLSQHINIALNFTYDISDYL